MGLAICCTCQHSISCPGPDQDDEACRSYNQRIQLRGTPSDSVFTNANANCVMEAWHRIMSPTMLIAKKQDNFRLQCNIWD